MYVWICIPIYFYCIFIHCSFMFLWCLSVYFFILNYSGHGLVKCAFIIKVMLVTKFTCGVFSFPCLYLYSWRSPSKKLKCPQQVWSHLTFWAPQRSLGSHTHNNCSISVRGHFISRSHPKGDPSALFIPSLLFLPPVFERFWALFFFNKLQTFCVAFKMLLAVNVTVVRHPIMCSLWLFHHEKVW